MALPLLDEQTPAPATRPAIAAKGFRVFFLLAATFAVVIVPVWLLVLAGILDPAAYVAPMYWHAHEMIFGFAVAVIAGFLLTAVGNWTKSETLVGAPLLALAALWVAGRVAFAVATSLPRGLVAVVDLAFVPFLALAIARPLVRTGNARNFVMLGFLVGLFAANAAVHADALGFAPGAARAGCIVGVDLVVLLIVVMAGRVFPMFTRNATGVESVRSMPALDRLAAASMLIVTLLDAAGVDDHVEAWFCAAGALLTAARAAPWITTKAMRVPLLWILHVGYAWIPLGLALRAVSPVGGAVSASLAMHALTAGAIGSLTLGMMVRVSLGHTGRDLVAPRSAAVAFVSVTLGALVRVGAPLVVPVAYGRELEIAGTAWSAAFAIFLAAFAPMLVRPRADGKAG